MLKYAISFAWVNPVIWFGFSLVFFYSGQTFTLWLLEPHRLNGGIEWLLVLLFPFLFFGFFVVNGRLQLLPAPGLMHPVAVLNRK